jgi:hypothetical protein
VSFRTGSNSRKVEHVVFGIREASSLHWLSAWAIIDNDGRTESDVAALKEKGVYALPFVSVESIYYHPEIVERLAKRHATVTGVDAKKCFESAKGAAFDALSQSHRQRLSGRVCENAVRRMALAQLPVSADIISGTSVSIHIDVAEIVAKERAKLERAIEAGDLLAVVERYPIRETPALDNIAKQLVV